MPALTLSDAELYEAVAEKKPWALSALYDRYATVLYSLALKILNREKDAQEVVEETFVTFWRKSIASRKDLGDHVGTWLILMCRTLARAHNRDAQKSVISERELTQLEDFIGYANGHPDLQLEAEEKNALRETLEQFSTQQRRAVEMAFLRGMSLTEIAKCTRVAAEEVRAQVHLAVRKLREHLQPQPV